MNLIDAQNLTLPLSGRETPLFENQSLLVREHERIAIRGASGSGKTLFLRSLCLLERHLQGQILWKGEAILDSQVPLYRSQVMYVGQKSVLSSGSVRTQFEEAFALGVHRSKNWDYKRTQQTFQFFGKPEDFLSRPVEHLSGGEKQLVHLLRAVALMPEVLCLDEPTSALDPLAAHRFESWLCNFYKGAWLWVTHDEGQSARVATRSLLIGKKEPSQS